MNCIEVNLVLMKNTISDHDELSVYDHFMGCGKCQHEMREAVRNGDASRPDLLKIAQLMMKYAPYKIGKNVPVECRLFKSTWRDDTEKMSREELGMMKAHFAKCPKCRDEFMALGRHFIEHGIVTPEMLREAKRLANRVKTKFGDA